MNDLILVVDDDPGVLLAFQKVLLGENFLIHATAQVDNTMEIIQNENPKVVIIDINMSNIKGLEMLRNIKQIHKKLPVVIMTAYSNIFTEKDALRLGADAYLKKPFDIKTMLVKLRTLNEIHKDISVTEVERYY